jgi:hypothetical protein
MTVNGAFAVNKIRALFCVIAITLLLGTMTIIDAAYAATKKQSNDTKKKSSRTDLIKSCSIIANNYNDSEDLIKYYKQYNTPLIILNKTVYLCPCEVRKLGGDAESRKLVGDAEGRNLGGDAEGRKLAGDTEGRHLGGDAEGRKLAGDTEDRKLSGGTEDRKLAGDAEGRKIAGGTESVSCFADEACGGFRVKGIDSSRIQVFNGTSIVSLDRGACVR